MTLWSKPFNPLMLPFKRSRLELEFEYSQKKTYCYDRWADGLHQLFLKSDELTHKSYYECAGKLIIKLSKQNKKVNLLLEDTAPGGRRKKKSEQKFWTILSRLKTQENRATGGKRLRPLLFALNIVVWASKALSVLINSPDGGLGIRIEFPLKLILE